MGTAATIAYQISPKQIRVIRLNGDGRTLHAGATLKKFYDTPEKVKDLMDLGDLSILGVDPFESIAYHRDRNESWKDTKPRLYRGETCMPNMLWDEPEFYIYVFDGEEWTAYGCGGLELLVIGGETIRE